MVKTTHRPMDSNDVQKEPPKEGLGWYFAGLASIGVLTGFFAGFSDSPVVKTLLPLLFALIAGTGGVYIAKIRFNVPEDKRRIEIVGQTLFIFGISCLLTATYGMVMRNGLGIQA